MSCPQPRVSIIIPAYDAQAFVSRAIDSVLAQDWPDVEIVVVNDGSRDGTESVCLEYGNRIRYISQGNAGVSAARNAGIAAAAGEFIGFLDADDEWLPQAARTLAELLMEFPTAGAASGAYIRRGTAGQTQVPQAGQVLPAGQARGIVPRFFSAFARTYFAWTGCILVRRQVMETVGTFRVGMHLGEDIELWSRVAGRYDWAFTDKTVSVYNLYLGASGALRKGQPPSPKSIYDDVQMRQLIRQQLWDDYRLYRRERVLTLGPAYLVYGATSSLRELMSSAEPVVANRRWLLLALASRLPGWLARPIASTVLQVKVMVRRLR